MKYAIHKPPNKKILRIASCPPEFAASQAKENENIVEAPANVNDMTQEIVNGKVVDKKPEEIEQPHRIPFEKRFAAVTNKQWQDVLNRLDKLEARSIKIGE